MRTSYANHICIKRLRQQHVSQRHIIAITLPCGCECRSCWQQPWSGCCPPEEAVWDHSQLDDAREARETEFGLGCAKVCVAGKYASNLLNHVEDLCESVVIADIDRLLITVTSSDPSNLAARQCQNYILPYTGLLLPYFEGEIYIYE